MTPDVHLWYNLQQPLNQMKRRWLHECSPLEQAWEKWRDGLLAIGSAHDAIDLKNYISQVMQVRRAARIAATLPRGVPKDPSYEEQRARSWGGYEYFVLRVGITRKSTSRLSRRIRTPEESHADTFPFRSMSSGHHWDAALFTGLDDLEDRRHREIQRLMETIQPS